MILMVPMALIRSCANSASKIWKVNCDAEVQVLGDHRCSSSVFLRVESEAAYWKHLAVYDHPFCLHNWPVYVMCGLFQHPLIWLKWEVSELRLHAQSSLNLPTSGNSRWIQRWAAPSHLTVCIWLGDRYHLAGLRMFHGHSHHGRPVLALGSQNFAHPLKMRTESLILETTQIRLPGKRRIDW